MAQAAPQPVAERRLALAVGGYCAVSTYLLYLFFADLRARFDLGTAVLAADLAMFSLVIYATGAERSWIFFLPLFRVADQTSTSFRRALLFAHLAPLSYAAVILQVQEELSTAEIAAVLACSEATVRVHLHRALKTLRQTLERR